MVLRIYNSLTRRLEEFTPLQGGEVRMYVCGPNLYGPSHVGHALSFLVFDVIRRYLEYRGYRVRHVQNFTDIEDRIIEAARDQGTTIDALARRYADRFLREMKALNVQPASEYPRATGAIPKMQEIIQGLLARGFAYVVDGDVFFRVTAFPAYGRLSGRSLDEMQAGSRIEVDPRKEHPMDFVLWKAASPGEPSWDSPWGSGRPGWHIECSAMALSYLGEELDIHGGGQDVVFPHHENEIAQSEAYTGKSPFVRYWVHNGLLRLAEGQEKMTRHLGNIVTIEEALARYHPDAIRVFVLSSHYRSPATWTDDALEAAMRGAERLRTATEHGETVLRETAARAGVSPARDRARTRRSAPGAIATGMPGGAEAARAAFEGAMDDDFNTPRALAAVFELATAVNKAADAMAKADSQAPRETAADLESGTITLRALAGVLGLTLAASMTPAQRAGLLQLASDLARERPDLFDPTHSQRTLLDVPGEPDAAEAISLPDASGEELIRFIAEGRMRARRQKDWATGDAIRSRLHDLGILLEDSPTGFTWRLR
jgi:cysteinyl-tRNA synthetase